MLTVVAADPVFVIVRSDTKRVSFSPGELTIPGIVQAARAGSGTHSTAEMTPERQIGLDHIASLPEGAGPRASPLSLDAQNRSRACQRRHVLAGDIVLPDAL